MRQSLLPAWLLPPTSRRGMTNQIRVGPPQARMATEVQEPCALQRLQGLLDLRNIKILRLSLSRHPEQLAHALLLSRDLAMARSRPESWRHHDGFRMRPFRNATVRHCLHHRPGGAPSLRAGRTRERKHFPRPSGDRISGQSSGRTCRSTDLEWECRLR